MANILCIESSIDFCSVCIHTDGKIHGFFKCEEAYSHSSILSILIQKAFALFDKDQLDAVAVATGPGSYTALRVGLSSAKGLCYGLDIPLIDINTLEIIAFPFQNPNISDFIVPTIDARRNEAYIAIYDKNFNIIVSDQAMILEENSFSDIIPSEKSILYCGNAVEKVEKICSLSNASHTFSLPTAEDMVEISLSRYNKGLFADTAYVTPTYIKPPNITKQKKNIITKR